MALDLTGIDNRGEFYSHHYLDALLESDLSSILKRWADAEQSTPPVRSPLRRLNGLAGKYFDARGIAAELHDPEARWQVARGVSALLLEALGYARAPTAVRLDDGTTLPLAAEERRGGHAALWVIETGFAPGESDPLDQPPLRAQLPDPDDASAVLPDRSWRELLDRGIFLQDDAPTWVLALCGHEVVLTHRHKWGRGKALAFDLDELFARRQPTAFRALAGLLHRDALVPTDGTSLHEALDQSSHKHAFAVSTDLRQGAQEAVEIVGNEAVHYLRTVRKKGVFGGPDGGAEEVDARELTRECLVWLYRLIFLLYVESRSEELGVAPMKSEAYRRGYSFESLRNLETVPLTTPQAQDGTYLDASLRQLFRLVNDGHPADKQLALDAGVDAVAFRIFGLRSQLFDDARTPILAKVRLRNRALQRVIELLSLSREGKRRERGRISYASLGINQLGAVYEGLLSYSGFFAQTDLIEVANAGENGRPGVRTWFVPAADRERYDEAELVRDASGARVQHAKGTFLFRLAGRDREKSASYYTPEVLTACLVKYTLRERIGVAPGDAAWVGADALLDLTICEPAMGSGAFLNEVVNQLAGAYLERKQAEVGDVIPAEAYGRELQRVKARIAARQCYGVDLNPLAAELGKVSLWLNVLRPGASAPFFDARIAVGNSLVGARRAVVRVGDLRKSKKGAPGWLELAPEPVAWGSERPSDAVWHFLVPAKGMAAFDGDKVVAGLAPEAVSEIKAWRKGLNAAWSKDEQARLLRLSAVVDRLWAEHASARREALRACDVGGAVWPEVDGAVASRDEEQLAAAWARHLEADSAGRRLKAVLDRWCAYWFWPVCDAGELPDRAAWLDEIEALLTGPLGAVGVGAAGERGRIAGAVAVRHRFLHWDWQFPEVFAAGGFDVVVGNPPWVRVEFKESGVLADLDPRLEIRRWSAKQVADGRGEVLGDAGALGAYLAEFEEQVGVGEFTGSAELSPELAGAKPNFYKSFLGHGWRILKAHGCGGLFHQSGVFDDPKGGVLRAQLYPRLRLSALFKNELRLFEGVSNQRTYCFTVWTGGPAEQVRFRYIANLFHPRTLDDSLAHDGVGEVPVIKGEDGAWDLRGHRSRIIEVDEATLALFAQLYDTPGTRGIQARLPVVHSVEVVSVLRALASADRLGPPGSRWMSTREWNGTEREDDGTLVRSEGEVETLDQFVVSGPHLYVATPFNKTPNVPCTHNQDYTVVDHAEIGATWLPRTVYRPAGPSEQYLSQLPTWRGRPLPSYFRYMHREMLAPTGERTLIPALLSPGATTLNTVLTVTSDDSDLLVRLAGLACTIPVDFFVKSTGSGHASVELTALLPVEVPPELRVPIFARVLRLNCLTAHYAPLWRELFTPAFAAEKHTKDDPRLPDFSNLGPEWTWDTPLRTPFARRQALVELDALAAIALGLTADELCLIYRVQFPVLQQYEADTWYDQRGRIAFTNNRGLTGVGLDRAQWDAIKGDALSPLIHGGVDPLPDWARDGLGLLLPSFHRCDREDDMRHAWQLLGSP
ncbi:MAG: hypothetical protein R2991_16695 [Thermoanaerobaculia bacterium]